MRMYLDIREALEEIKRDLKEMGIEVRTKTMQDKNIELISTFFTLELQNYNYMVLNVDPTKVPGVSQPWADSEFLERIRFKPVNPGEAWKSRTEIWEPLLEGGGKFSYTYGERLHLNYQLERIIGRIKEDPQSRQLWLSIWSPDIDPSNMGGKKRIPCSLGYNFQVREGKLNMHYLMRSCDFNTHLVNDIYLAQRLLLYVADKTNYPVGTFTHTIFSLHIYKKDVEGVF